MFGFYLFFWGEYFEPSNFFPFHSQRASSLFSPPVIKPVCNRITNRKAEENKAETRRRVKKKISVKTSLILNKLN